MGKSTDLWIKDEVRAGLFRGTLIDGGCRVLLIDDDTDNLDRPKQCRFGAAVALSGMLFNFRGAFQTSGYLLVRGAAAEPSGIRPGPVSGTI